MNDLSLSEAGKKIKNRFLTEITAQKTKISQQIAALGSNLPDQIRVAAQAKYGPDQNKNLTAEQAQIFTTHASQITSPELLNQIKELLNLLVEAEKIKPNDRPAVINLSLTNLKKSYQNGTGDKKLAYATVNKVDNRTELKNKWNNQVVARKVFEASVLDSIPALEEAEKLLVKVQTAQAQKEVDSSLLTELENYSSAPRGEIKNKAYQAVNGDKKRVQKALEHLREISQKRIKIVEGLQNARNQTELDTAYQTIKNSDFYQSEKNRQLTDKIHTRKKVCLEIASDNSISAPLNQFLQNNLIKIIPESIQNTANEAELTRLESELKGFLKAGKGEEKEQIYQKYQGVINDILTEISQEKQR
ncbi:2664_t:CDS:2 [Funneliformis geosporum]|uniref:2664_t:CDS:1 n=1 Tax=Funneliformis geosporum TaxID=1117311 RepID=A0A9W4SFS5_9GLOM|nr:2664_t:CDS:2 [Funneliformis geosporum]